MGVLPGAKPKELPNERTRGGGAGPCVFGSWVWKPALCPGWLRGGVGARRTKTLRLPPSSPPYNDLKLPMGESAAQRKAREMREQRANKKRKKERKIEQRYALHVKRYKAAGVVRQEREDRAKVERVLVVLISTVVTQCVRARNLL